MPRWLVPIAVLGVFVGLLALSNREPTIDGVPMISTADQYNRLSQETQAWLAEPLLRADGGGELTEEDRATLNRGVPVFRALADFSPTEMTPFFVLGKLYQNLGRAQQAEESSRQAIYNGEVQLTAAKNSNDAKRISEVQTLLNESRHVHAQALFELKEYEESFRDMKTILQDGNPQSQDVSRYLVTAARALIQMGDIPAAKASLQDALKRDANNSRAREMLKLLEKGDT